jgi:hypothetical protein|tara:strand:- start:33 stop:185 length:153 start_codon:yes stop_codon:yes gene_type:complete
MKEENNTLENLDRLFKASEITLTDYNFRKLANKLNIKTFKDNKTNTIKYI